MRNPSANLKGMLDLVKASKNPLAPIFEAITNSLESILELKSDKVKSIDLSLIFNDADETALRLDSVEIRDDGAGFNEASYGRFMELLDKSKGNHNRGTGRLQYFHRFGLIKIISVYQDNEKLLRRELDCSKDNFAQDNVQFEKNSKTTSSVLKLQDFEPLKGDVKFFEELNIEALSSKLKSKFALRAYLDSTRGINFPTINIKYQFVTGKESQLQVLDSLVFPEPSSSGEFSIPYSVAKLNKNSEVEWVQSDSMKPELFKWFVFEFQEDDIESHGAYLCSKDIAVQSVQNPLINKSCGFNSIKKITAFCGDYLDRSENVNQSVDAFCIKKKGDVKSSDLAGNLLCGEDGYVYLDDIETKAEDLIKKIYEEIEEAQNERDRRRFELAKALGISKIIASKIKVKPTDSDDVITLALHQEEAKYVAKKANKTRAIVQELDSLDTSGENYLKDLKEKAESISNLLDEQNKEELSKYVVRRELVATLLDKILRKDLNVQIKPLPKGKNRDREGIIHDLIFKRKKTSGGWVNDLWILNEEFVHFDGFSELEISKMTLPNGESLLRKEAKGEIEKYKFNPKKRPDIFLFANEGKCILVEFKEPDTNLSHYLHQMPQYCKLLANYSNLKIQNFYCYLIGEKIFPEADLDEYEESVNGDWYRDAIPVKRAGGERERIASIRMEIIKLSDIADRAHKRNRSFAEKLGLDILTDSLRE